MKLTLRIKVERYVRSLLIVTTIPDMTGEGDNMTGRAFKNGCNFKLADLKCLKYFQIVNLQIFCHLRMYK